MAPQGPCHWRKRSLEPCCVSPLDHLLPLGMAELLCWLVSPAPHPHPLPSACGLGKAQAQSPLPHPVHSQPGRALCLLPPGAPHALCHPGMHVAPRKAGCSPNPGYYPLQIAPISQPCLEVGVLKVDSNKLLPRAACQGPPTKPGHAVREALANKERWQPPQVRGIGRGSLGTKRGCPQGCQGWPVGRGGTGVFLI